MTADLEVGIGAGFELAEELEEEPVAQVNRGVALLGP
jgi:hypothetical protein